MERLSRCIEEYLHRIIIERKHDLYRFAAHIFLAPFIISRQLFADRLFPHRLYRRRARQHRLLCTSSYHKWLTCIEIFCSIKTMHNIKKSFKRRCYSRTEYDIHFVCYPTSEVNPRDGGLVRFALHGAWRKYQRQWISQRLQFIFQQSSTASGT